MAAGPEDAGYWFAQGLTRLDEGSIDQAEECFRKVLALDPRHAKASVNLGLILQRTGRGDEAAGRYRDALAADSRLAQAWFNLGTVLMEQGQGIEAIRHFRRALALDPGQAGWQSTLGSALMDAGELETAVAAWRRALEMDPASQRTQSNILWASGMLPEQTPERIHEERLAWARRCVGAPRCAEHLNSRAPERRLRIGYLSPDFLDEAMRPCIEPVLAWHDRSKFEVLCYSDAEATDPVGWRLRILNSSWRATAHLSDEQLAERIRVDRIDILVDLAGHGAGGARIPVLARKPAPVQVAWLGDLNTTALEAIDYRITDRYASPEGMERFYIEQLVHMPGNQLCFRPEFDSPEVGPLPVRAHGSVTFGCFRDLAMITPRVAALWARLLQIAEESKLIVISHKAAHLPDRIAQTFRNAGVDPGRIECHGQMRLRSRLSLLSRIDIALDTYPVSGITETLHALWMGVPVVTLSGRTVASRSSAGLMDAIGLKELVADTEEQYLAIAVSLARDLPRLDGLRRALRRRLSESLLTDTERFARDLETAYRRMWRAWCLREPARPMQIESLSGQTRSTYAVRRQARLEDSSAGRIVVDGVFFQDYNTGIARVWRSLLHEWARSGFAARVLLLDRDGTAPTIRGVDRRLVARHPCDGIAEDRAMLQQVCDEEGASVFVSTYYTSPLTTPSVMLAYDMIPEVFSADTSWPELREKETCIGRAARFVAISRNTARDLCSFYPQIDPGRVTVAHCGVDPLFQPAGQAEVSDFKRRHGIARPYFLWVGSRVTYKNGNTFFRAFARLPDRARYGVVCTGGEGTLDPEHRACCAGSELHLLRLEDRDLRLAYCGAMALVYPTVYEGFGMPVAEAMASGCPVVTTECASIPEVAGDAALYVKPMDVVGLTEALKQVRQPELRAELGAKGIERARLFSWSRMAQIVAAALTETSDERSG